MGKEMNKVSKDVPTIALSNDELFSDCKKSNFLTSLTPRHIVGGEQKELWHHDGL